jgi:hypothetical protein
LLLNLYLGAGFAQLSGPHINLKNIKAQETLRRVGPQSQGTSWQMGELILPLVVRFPGRLTAPSEIRNSTRYQEFTVA